MFFLSGRFHGRQEFNARDDRGATAVEYGLMASLIAVVIIGGVLLFGQSVKALFVMSVAARPFG